MIPSGLLVQLRRERDDLAKKAEDMFKALKDISNAQDRKNNKKALTKGGMMRLAKEVVERYQK